MQKRKLEVLQEQYDSTLAEIATGTFQTRVGQDLRDLYVQLQAETGKDVVTRDAMNSERVADLSVYLTLNEVIGPDKVMLQAVGQKTIARIGHDPTGKNLFDFVGEDYKAQYNWHFKHMIEERFGAVAIICECFESTKLLVEQVSFPLADEDGEVRHVVVSSEYVDPTRGASAIGKATLTGQTLGYHGIDIGFGIPCDMIEYG